MIDCRYTDFNRIQDGWVVAAGDAAEHVQLTSYNRKTVSPPADHQSWAQSPLGRSGIVLVSTTTQSARAQPVPPYFVTTPAETHHVDVVAKRARGRFTLQGRRKTSYHSSSIYTPDKQTSRELRRA